MCIRISDAASRDSSIFPNSCVACSRPIRSRSCVNGTALLICGSCNALSTLFKNLVPRHTHLFSPSPVLLLHVTLEYFYFPTQSSPIFIRHPISAPIKRFASVASICFIFSSTIVSEIELIFTAKVPPNPQQSWQYGNSFMSDLLLAITSVVPL